MSQAFKRAERVAEMVHAELSRLLREEVRDPRLTAVSITAVRLTNDLRHARIYYVPLGGKGDMKAIQAGLDRSKGFFRSRVAKRLQLRYTPDMRFFADDHLEQAVAMTSLLSRLVPQETEE
jgi:ribosome-binding factor A